MSAPGSRPKPPLRMRNGSPAVWYSTHAISSRPVMRADYARAVREPGLLSVVAPMHDEEDTVAAFHARTVAALDGLEFELLLVDDGSKDRTGELLRGLAAPDERVKVVALSRNFGHQAALSAGLEHA